MTIAALYTSVTNGIIQELEAGAAPWLKPWKSGQTAGVLPQNAATGRPYTGINIPILWAAADQQSFPRNAWLTFKQAAQAGGHVRKGEKGTTVVFTRQITVEEEAEARHLPVLRTFTVFNVAQVQGIQQPEPAPLPAMPVHTAAEQFLTATRADIRDGGNQACYVPRKISSLFRHRTPSARARATTPPCFMNSATGAELNHASTAISPAVSARVPMPLRS